MKENKEIICLTPYQELRFGCDSIHNHIQAGCRVPDKVIIYLKTTQPYLMCPGVYSHPFRPDVQLLGPYTYTDGHYFWDRDTWKYVVKYGLVLPPEFIDHVMSDDGTRFLKQFSENNRSWSSTIGLWKESEDGLCLLPDNAGDIDLEDF